MKSEILNVESLDLLSPEMLRTRTKTAGGKLGLGGEKLAAFIHESGKEGKEGKEKLQQLLAKVYRQLESIETRSFNAFKANLENVVKKAIESANLSLHPYLVMTNFKIDKSMSFTIWCQYVTTKESS